MKTNQDPRLDGILPGLIYLTGEEPENKILVWREMHDPTYVKISGYDLHTPAGPLPPDTIQSTRAATIVGYGPESTLTEAIHELGDLYVVAGVTVTGRYRVEDWMCHSLPSNPSHPTEPEPLPYVTELEPTELALASDLVQAQFQAASAHIHTELDPANPVEPGYLAALAAAGTRVLDVLKDGWTFKTLTVEQIAQLTTWAASTAGYDVLLTLSLTFEPSRWFASHWRSLIAVVPAELVSIPASLLAATAWRTGHPLLAYKANDLAARWANELFPPVHKTVASMITADICKRAAVG